MIKISFSEADIEALRYWRIQHPDPRVQMRMDAAHVVFAPFLGIIWCF
jgi:hypothetical protein